VPSVGQFDDCRLLDQWAYDLLTGDFPRAQNRRRIADLANGYPPYSDDEVTKNGIVVNINDLSMTRIQHDARAQFYNGIMKPGRFFTATLHSGIKHKRKEWGAIVTAEIARAMKRNIGYFESLRSKFGLLTLHGIAPAVWETRDKWCPRAIGVEDALIPSGTLLGFENLPFFMLRRSFTGMELARYAFGDNRRNPGWNKPMVERCMEWLDDQMVQLYNSNWPDIWSPEKWAERYKQDGAFYSSDQCPTIECFDVYGYVDDGKDSGWVRRIILDSWSTPESQIAKGGLRKTVVQRKHESGGRYEGYPKIEYDNDFLFSSRDRRWARNWQQLVSFQFADLSCVAPFRYHSVRSLGFLLYSVCQLQNRLRCRFNESVFEALTLLMRVKTQEDIQRALEVQIGNKKFVDESVQFIPANERWAVPHQLVELGLKENTDLMQSNASSWVQNQNFSQDKTHKTKFQVMAEVNNASAMVGAALNQAYRYMEVEYEEVFRRFLMDRSTDPDVRRVRENVLRQGVPEKHLQPEQWEIAASRVVGAGNKTMEMAISEALMQYRNLFDPEPQRDILRLFTTNITDDPDLAQSLVPDQPQKVNQSTHDADLTFATLMQGIQVGMVTGENHIEIVEELLRQMAGQIQKFQKTGMAPPDKIQGFQMVAQYIAQHIRIIAQDPQEKPRVKKYQDALGKLMNLVKAFAQRLQKMMEARQKAAQQNGNGQMDPKDKAKIAATQAQSQAKIANMRESHAARTAQRQIQFEQQQKQDAEKHKADLDAKDLETASEIRRSRFNSMEEE